MQIMKLWKYIILWQIVFLKGEYVVIVVLLSGAMLCILQLESNLYADNEIMEI